MGVLLDRVSPRASLCDRLRPGNSGNRRPGSLRSKSFPLGARYRAQCSGRDCFIFLVTTYFQGLTQSTIPQRTDGRPWATCRRPAELAVWAPGLDWGRGSKDSPMQPGALQEQPTWRQTRDGSASQSTALRFPSPMIPEADSPHWSVAATDNLSHVHSRSGLQSGTATRSEPRGGLADNELRSLDTRPRHRKEQV